MDNSEYHFSDEKTIESISLNSDNICYMESSIVEEQPIPNNSDYFVTIATQSTPYCVGLVDMIGSTKLSAYLGPKKASRCYQIFLNSMANIIAKFDGAVIKNVGDCLVYYFPDSHKPALKPGFISCLECSLAMIDYWKTLCENLKREKLPCVDYRISADYGPVIVMRTNKNSSLDMVGPPLNMCSKINRLAGKNKCVVGGDLYSMVKKSSNYKFREIKDYNLGLKYSYPVYELSGLSTRYCI